MLEKAVCLEPECIQDIRLVASAAEPARETGAGRWGLEACTKLRIDVTAELIATQLIENKEDAYRNRSIHETKLESTQLIENKQPRSLQIDTKSYFSDEYERDGVRPARAEARRRKQGEEPHHRFCLFLLATRNDSRKTPTP
jgi:hypothetical protein